MELTYTNVNGYLIPNLTCKSGEQIAGIGKYGFLRKDYLKKASEFDVSDYDSKR